MEIRGQAAHSPFLIYYNKDRVGIPVNWLLSAVGRAYLAIVREQVRQSSRAFA
jgi:hypothetical protein